MNNIGAAIAWSGVTIVFCIAIGDWRGLSVIVGAWTATLIFTWWAVRDAERHPPREPPDRIMGD